MVIAHLYMVVRRPLVADASQSVAVGPSVSGGAPVCQ